LLDALAREIEEEERGLTGGDDLAQIYRRQFLAAVTADRMKRGRGVGRLHRLIRCSLMPHGARATAV
jgi:hypothetical protein